MTITNRRRRSVTEERAYLVDLIDEAAGERLPEGVRYAMKRVLSPRALGEMVAWVDRLRARGLPGQGTDARPEPASLCSGLEVSGPVEFEPEEGDPDYEPPPGAQDFHPRCPEPECGGDLGGVELGRLESHVPGCPRFPL